MGLDKLFIVKTTEAQKGVDRVVALNVEHVLYGAALEVFVALRNLVTLEPVATTLACEEQHGLMHGGGIDILGKVLFACACALGSHSTSCLLAELAQRRALDVAQMAHGYHHGVVGIEVFGVELVLVRLDLGTTGIAILFLNLLKLILHDLLAQFGIVKDCLQMGDELLQLFILVAQLVHAQTCELCQTHVYDGLRLELVKLETLLKVALGVDGGLAGSDDVDHLIDIVARDDETLNDVGTVLCFLQVKLGAADHNIVTMLYEVGDAVFQREKTRTALH